MKTFALQSWLVGVILLFAGCGGDGTEKACGGSGANSIDGSYCEGLDISFTEVKTLLVTGSAVRIEYLRPTGTTQEKALQIIVPLSAIPNQNGTEILIGQVSGAAVQRLLSTGVIPLTDQLDESSSRVRFDSYSGELDTDVKGEFNFLIESGGRQLTLRGTFEGTLEDALPGTN